MEPQHPPRTIRQNLRVLIPVALVQSAVYLTLNHWQWRPVRELPLSVVDEWLPFLPWTVIPYMLFFLGGFPVALTIQSDRVLRRGVIAYFLCLAMTAPIFLFWPTACPRPELSSLEPSWDLSLYELLTVLDTPACSFPSMHIMLPTIICWAIWAERRWWAGWYIAAMLLLSLTILTTKQHYAWDWLGGLGIACLALILAARFDKPPREADVT